MQCIIDRVILSWEDKIPKAEEVREYLRDKYRISIEYGVLDRRIQKMVRKGPIQELVSVT